MNSGLQALCFKEDAMNSGDEKLLRLFKLQTSVNSLVLEGKRPADSLDPLIDAFQQFVFGQDLDIDLWRETHKALRLEAEFSQVASGLVLPDDKKLWYMPMGRSITSNKIVAGCRSGLGIKFSLYDEDLDSAVPKHDRDANRDGPYIIGFRRNVEADEEFANKSANMLAEVSHKGICLPERLLLGAGYYVATGQHLDTRTWTLCTGSRFVDGSVPYVYFHPDDGRVYVDWYYPGTHDPNVRSRSVDFCRILPA